MLIKGRDDHDSDALSLRSLLDCQISAKQRFLETYAYGWGSHQHVLYDLYHGLLAPGNRR